MNKRTKKILSVLFLIGALLAVQVMELIAFAAEVDGQAVQVSTWDELVTAMDAASDGDVIEITSEITIPKGSTLGTSDKKVILQRSGTDGFFMFEWSAGDEMTTVQNMVFDGAGVASSPFLQAYHNASFEGVTFMNCQSSEQGGALSFNSRIINLTDCIFKDNSAVSGGHLALMGMGTGTATIINCSFTNGHANSNGGAIFIQDGFTCNMQNSVVKENSADGLGGGFANHGELNFALSKVFKNHANNANDIYNTSSLSMETGLSELEAIYADEPDIVVKGWVTGTEEITNAAYIKLDYEVKQTPTEPQEPTEPVNPGENQEPTEDTGQKEPQEPIDQTTPQEPSEPTEKPDESLKPTEQPDTDKKDETPSDSSSSTNSNSSNNSSTSSSSTNTTTSSTDNSRVDNSRTENTTSDNSSVVNNYYYNTEPTKEAASEDQVKQVQEQTTQPASVQAASQAPATIIIKEENSKESDSVQQVESPSINVNPDPSNNIRIDAKGADVVFEVKDGVYSISINAEGAAEPVQQGQDAEAGVNWYEIIKIGLLGAIVVVIFRKTS